MKLRNGLIAIAVALCADFCFKILHEHLIGVCFFMATQALILLALSGYRQDS